jgi:hypothetical protein
LGRYSLFFSEFPLPLNPGQNAKKQRRGEKILLIQPIPSLRDIFASCKNTERLRLRNMAKRNHTGAEHSRFVRHWLLKEEKIALPFVESNCLSMIMTRRGAKF